ncbi:hypothetical protein HpBT077_01380 [Helicobacter pylori]
MCYFHSLSLLSKITTTPSIKSKKKKKKKKNKKELKLLKKPQFVAEFIKKRPKILHKASGNLLKIRVSHKNDTA